MNNFYKRSIQKYISPGWKAGLFLIILFSIPRIIVVLQASLTGNYQFVSILFIIMWLMPFLLLSRQGRQEAGIKKPDSYSWIVIGFLLGIGCCIGMYYIATWLFAHTTQNWFVYISRTYTNLPNVLIASDRNIYFLVYSAISMTFSPVGEEILYRGIIHENFAAEVGDTKASLIDSTAFSLVHLAHFGIVYVDQRWQILYFPAFLWVSLLFGTCLVFYMSRRKSGSLSGAIASHAGFNLAMNYYIFYHIL